MPLNAKTHSKSSPGMSENHQRQLTGAQGQADWFLRHHVSRPCPLWHEQGPHTHGSKILTAARRTRDPQPNQEEGTTEGEMVGWPHWLNGREREQTRGASDGQGGLACCRPWGRKEADMTYETEQQLSEGQDKCPQKCVAHFFPEGPSALLLPKVPYHGSSFSFSPSGWKPFLKPVRETGFTLLSLLSSSTWPLLTKNPRTTTLLRPFQSLISPSEALTLGQLHREISQGLTTPPVLQTTRR